jgi:hypothetical protein
MKTIKWTLGIAFGLVIMFFGLQYMASERIEVVDLQTTNETGENVSTRLWVVDDEGYPYLRVGADGSGWFSRLQENGEIRVTRNGNTDNYTTVLRADKNAKINQLMQDKYTWGDTFFAYVVGGRTGSIPVELHKIN